MILWLKILHIATLSVWCAGLVGLPLLYARRPVVAEGGPLFELQAFTRFLFVTLVSPAAFLAIGSGTALIFLRETFTLWFAAKLLAVGVLALLHLDAADYAVERKNPVGPEAWATLAARCDPAAKGVDRKMLDQIKALLPRLAEPWSDPALPRGPIHADYFPDNVLFATNEHGKCDVGGVIDFYFGCTDVLAYDLAIALSAWGFDAEGRPMHSALRAFQKGYESVRPLTPAEAEALPGLGAAAAVRFTLTRLHDRLFHDPANLVTPKDPAPFFRRLDYWKAAETV